MLSAHAQAQIRSINITLKVQKKKDLPKTWILRGNRLKLQTEKRTEKGSRPCTKKQLNARIPKATNYNFLCKQYDLN